MPKKVRRQTHPAVQRIPRSPRPGGGSRAHIGKLMDRGFHHPGDVETRLGHYLGGLAALHAMQRGPPGPRLAECSPLCRITIMS